MVLCAGFGTRLGDLTREIPKPMLPLPERPLLAYLLAHLRAHGFAEIAINLHFRPEAIRGYFGDGAKMNLALTYAQEEHLLGTAGGVKNMEIFLRQSDPFLVQYGDVVTDQDFTAMLRFHQEREALATLLLHQRAKSNSVVSLDAEGRITGFLERPSAAQRRGVESNWVNSGICLCRPVILSHIPAGTACDLPRDIFPKLIGAGRLFGFPLTGYRCAIDSPERLAEARAAVTEGRCRISI
jgi:NDP-sugar pyrophosphorylase family protein